MNKSVYDDLSTSSFYSVQVTSNENRLIIKSTNPNIEGKDKLL